MPGTNVPYRYITGLPETAQREIERDFLAVVQQLGLSPSVFDAIIDPALTASDPGSHEYINLTDLVANEVWAPGTLFNIGVRQRADVGITETVDLLDVSALGDIALFGNADFAPLSGRVAWDWAPLDMAVGQQLFLHNLTFTISVESA